MNPPRILLRCLLLVSLFSFAVSAAEDRLHELAPGVYFHEGDSEYGLCNNGWIVFDDYVLVVDANFPKGAKIIMERIAETSDKPVKVVFDTHHHSDHSYGNQLWADQGALLVAQERVVEQMKMFEPDEWNWRAKDRPDMQMTNHKMPSVLFKENMWFDDGEQRAELHFFGAGHTQGDGYVWLPKQKILFTGDGCVNGPFNYLGNASVASWIETLERVKQLGAEIVCPGHGPVGGKEIVVDQQRFLKELYSRVKALHDAGKTSAEAKAAISGIYDELKSISQIERYVAGGLPGQAEFVWKELGGDAFPE
jgi:glyoxylase-like metal-dependent hydrolase (beta-lactamase superfamily II)